MTGFAVSKSDSEWRAELSAERFRVLRLKGTERPGTGELTEFFPESGYFACAGCGNQLYSSSSKFDSGCGWPAFDKFVAGSVVAQEDDSLGMRRIEIMCSRCGGHLGHVFWGEGFTPSNERHCVNSASLRFVDQAIENSVQEDTFRK